MYKKKETNSIGEYTEQETDKRLYRKKKKRETKQNKSGGLGRLQLPNSFLLFLSRRYPLLGMISTSDNPPDLIGPLPTRITSTGTFIGEWIGLFVFFLDGNAQV